MKHAISLVTLALAGCAAHNPQPPDASPASIGPVKAFPGVLNVVALYLTAGKRGNANAVAVNGVLVTALHSVAGADLITVTLANGSDAPASVAAFDEEADLAILGAEIAKMSTLKLASRLPALGDVVTAILHDDTASTGKVTAMNGDDIYTDAHFAPGDAGGALLNTEGKLVGVLLGQTIDGRSRVIGGKELARLVAQGPAAVAEQNRRSRPVTTDAPMPAKAPPQNQSVAPRKPKG